MTTSLLEHFQNELRWLRHSAPLFAQRHPDVAKRLGVGDVVADPHIERLLEGFAFLAARVHERLDGDFPEITGALLDALSPQFRAPVPSMAVAQFVRAQPGGSVPPQGWPVAPMTTELTVAAPGQEVDLRYRVPVATTVWPVTVHEVRLEAAPAAVPPWPKVPEAASVLRMHLRCVGGERKWGALAQLDRLRFFLRAKLPRDAFALHEMLVHDTVGMWAGVTPSAAAGARRPPAKAVRLHPRRPVAWGLEEDEAVLPQSPQILHGNRLLLEYFACPERFLFVEIRGLDAAAAGAQADEMELRIYLSTRDERLEKAIANEKELFLLGCVPVVNLFDTLVEGIPLTQRASSHELVCNRNQREAHEVYTVDAVRVARGVQVEPVDALYGFRGAMALDARPSRWAWFASRRPSLAPDDRGTDVDISIVDRDLNHFDEVDHEMTVQATCLNRDLPGRIQKGQLAVAVKEAAGLKAGLVTVPTPTFRLTARSGDLRRLVSQLALNHLSLTERTALQELLRLHERTDSAVNRARIQSIEAISARPGIMTVQRPWPGVCRGIEVGVTIDDSKHDDGGWHLFASVLERVLASYCSINSFTQLKAVRKGREQEVYAWPKRAGAVVVV